MVGETLIARRYWDECRRIRDQTGGLERLEREPLSERLGQVSSKREMGYTVRGVEQAAMLSPAFRGKTCPSLRRRHLTCTDLVSQSLTVHVARETVPARCCSAPNSRCSWPRTRSSASSTTSLMPRPLVPSTHGRSVHASMTSGRRSGPRFRPSWMRRLQAKRAITKTYRLS